ncbi:MAG TPA: 4-(cytidine 5'-diphospho)-2-C-methyl-D-erythritol kinase [Bacteroidales bacterium]|nr:4-(cytidine 5'-diphospho)-2-C-methyl-D-erythritol kinase [Bacteroidales bacterium]
MICFPNIKINIGLDILSKREDGYHNIETVFYPIAYEDILEILPSEKFELINHGLIIDCPTEKNLCYKAFKIIEERYDIPPVKIILYKNVPFGTGLGSGSSDAAHTLILLNKLFKLNISEIELLNYASLLGADCAFFIKNKPVSATGIGNIFKEINLNLSGKSIVICFPDLKVNTANAYKNCKPQKPQQSLDYLINLPTSHWRNSIKNDFEDTIFKEYPVLKKIKNELYKNGAIYAQMSGSGSAIYGIFETKPKKLNLTNCKTINIFTL